jgi:hypothetical protein
MGIGLSWKYTNRNTPVNRFCCLEKRLGKVKPSRDQGEKLSNKWEDNALEKNGENVEVLCRLRVCCLFITRCDF